MDLERYFDIYLIIIDLKRWSALRGLLTAPLRSQLKQNISKMDHSGTKKKVWPFWNNKALSSVGQHVKFVLSCFINV